LVNNSIKIGDLVPEFELISTTGKLVSKNSIAGKTVLFFIYPKDDTASCTKEAKNFSNYEAQFAELGVKVFGISKDSIQSHNKFSSKHSLTVELLSDESVGFIKSMGAWVEKQMYGKTYMGVERTSLLISDHGKLLKIWRKVRVSGHVEEVVETIKKLN
jgi:peroxiredoxin Q/BCP